MTTLAELLRDVDQVACLKIDVEGAELGVLQGLGADLAKVAVLVFENQRDPAPLVYLEARGFVISRLDATNCLARRPNA
jgi:hypothetical protein